MLGGRSPMHIMKVILAVHPVMLEIGIMAWLAERRAKTRESPAQPRMPEGSKAGGCASRNVGGTASGAFSSLNFVGNVWTGFAGRHHAHVVPPGER